MPTPSLRRPFNTVRIHTGHGDLIMALNGLQALHEPSADPCRPRPASMRAPTRRRWPGCCGRKGRSNRCPSRRTLRTHAMSSCNIRRSLRYYVNWLTRDYYVNFPERRLLASYAYPRLGAGRRVLQLLTDLRFGASLDWRRETPSYYALRMWAPLARALGFTETDLMRGLHMAHRTLRGRLQTHIATLSAQDPVVPEVALFPSGGSFQYFPAGFTQTLLAQAGIAAGGYVCYFGPKDPTLEEYRARGDRMPYHRQRGRDAARGRDGAGHRDRGRLRVARGAAYRPPARGAHVARSSAAHDSSGRPHSRRVRSAGLLPVFLPPPPGAPPLQHRA